MGEAKRKKQARENWPESDSYRGTIDLRVLPAVSSIDGARIAELTGDERFAAAKHVVLRAFEATAGQRKFHVGFCLGDGKAFSAIGLAVIERLMLEAPQAKLHVVPITFEDIAWDIVLRHLRSFTGHVLLFAFPNSDVYDAGTAEISFSRYVRQFGPEGQELKRLTDTDRRRIQKEKAAILNRPPPEPFYATTRSPDQDIPWIFRVVLPNGKTIRTAVWNGRRDYTHEMPEDIIRWVGGDKIAIVQVDRPVGVDRRSSLQLTHTLAEMTDGVIHWARDTETFNSIVRSFVRLDLESVAPPDLPTDWKPDVVLIPANSH